jgi:hypothetical protein
MRAASPKGAVRSAKLDNPFCNGHFEGREEHPVNCVDHRDATSYCGFVGKRLPTEREWEYAARGGAEQRLYAWGNEEPDRSRSCYMHEGGSCEVGRYALDAFGTRDLTGNVWEWTASAFLPYPAEATEGLFYVYRGGSWSRRFAKWMRNDLRNRYRPGATERFARVSLRSRRPAAALPGRKRGTGRALHPAPRARFALPTRHLPRRRGLQTDGRGLARRDGRHGSCPGHRFGVDLGRSCGAAPATGARSQPGHDADCAAHYPGKPFAYQWNGGRFEEREPLIAQAGCAKRDIGQGWTSACCAR